MIRVVTVLRLAYFDLSVLAAGMSGLSVVSVLNATGIGGIDTMIGQEFGIVGVLSLAVAVLLVRREVNRVLKAVDSVQEISAYISDHDARIRVLEAEVGVQTGRYRRRLLPSKDKEEEPT